MNPLLLYPVLGVLAVLAVASVISGVMRFNGAIATYMEGSQPHKPYPPPPLRAAGPIMLIVMGIVLLAVSIVILVMSVP